MARLEADLIEGRKTGWYYDQCDNRAFAARLAKGVGAAGAARAFSTIRGLVKQR